MFSCDLLFGSLYDILAVTISVLDVVTDIIVLVGFYQQERWIFFGLSLSIILLALLSYTIAFEIRYVQPSHLSEAVAVFITMLIFSPFIPFFFYFAHKNSSVMSKCCGMFYIFIIIF